MLVSQKNELRIKVRHKNVDVQNKASKVSENKLGEKFNTK